VSQVILGLLKFWPKVHSPKEVGLSLNTARLFVTADDSSSNINSSWFYTVCMYRISS